MDRREALRRMVLGSAGVACAAGARAARVNQFIDTILEDAPPAERESFIGGLAWIDRRSRASSGADFITAPPGEQVALLTVISSRDDASPDDREGVEFFEAIKRLTITGYYTSEVGMREELDGERVDAWGIPILHISAAFGDNERRMVADMADTAMEMLAAAGAEDISRQEQISPPGLAIHEVGTARMGNDAATSVLNRWQQAHDVSNLFVMDGSCYVSSACQNPTLTMMALAARACDYLVEEYRASRM